MNRQFVLRQGLDDCGNHWYHPEPYLSGHEEGQVYKNMLKIALPLLLLAITAALTMGVSSPCMTD